MAYDPIEEKSILVRATKVIKIEESDM